MAALQGPVSGGRLQMSRHALSVHAPTPVSVHVLGGGGGGGEGGREGGREGGEGTLHHTHDIHDIT